MRFAVFLVVLGAVVAVWGRLCLRVVAWHEGGGSGGSRRARTDGARAPRSPRARQPLPVGHRPPPGLGPLSPSERFLTEEAARGLRELQLFLVDQRA